MPDCNNGKIYKIYNTITDDIYIGATTQLLCERMRGHRKDYKGTQNINNKLYQHFNRYGKDNFYIMLLEHVKCNSKEELTAREGEYIIKLKPRLNTTIEGRTRKQHYEDNKDKLLEDKKEYYEDNKSKILEYKKTI